MRVITSGTPRCRVRLLPACQLYLHYTLSLGEWRTHESLSKILIGGAFLPPSQTYLIYLVSNYACIWTPPRCHSSGTQQICLPEVPRQWLKFLFQRQYPPDVAFLDQTPRQKMYEPLFRAASSKAFFALYQPPKVMLVTQPRKQ